MSARKIICPLEHCEWTFTFNTTASAIRGFIRHLEADHRLPASGIAVLYVHNACDVALATLRMDAAALHLRQMDHSRKEVPT